eukprot:TRINITY_DN1057_c0_g1_i1.p1 TRINITY_DN1057_c0_g1~~TRINITY_DN1057_c0_g1_i1.p1  ORF type:complete len:317 (-),score=79.81 TRINITY_DN1057_c0_g1_i1:500-1450(-)
MTNDLKIPVIIHLLQTIIGPSVIDVANDIDLLNVFLAKLIQYYGNNLKIDLLIANIFGNFRTIIVEYDRCLKIGPIDSRTIGALIEVFIAYGKNSNHIANIEILSNLLYFFNLYFQYYMIDSYSYDLLNISLDMTNLHLQMNGWFSLLLCEFISTLISCCNSVESFGKSLDKFAQLFKSLIYFNRLDMLSLLIDGLVLFFEHCLDQRIFAKLMSLKFVKLLCLMLQLFNERDTQHFGMTVNSLYLISYLCEYQGDKEFDDETLKCFWNVQILIVGLYRYAPKTILPSLNEIIHKICKNSQLELILNSSGLKELLKG